MSAQVEPSLDQNAVQSAGRGAIASFIDSLIAVIVIGLMTVGLVALSLTWRTSDMEFMDGGKLRVTRSTWWGFQKEVTELHATGMDGWTIERQNGDRVPLRSQSIRLHN